METVNIRDARRRLSRLVDKAAPGEDVVVCCHGKPLVRITRLEAAKRQVSFGLLAGKVTLQADFDVPLPDQVLADIEGH